MSEFNQFQLIAIKTLDPEKNFTNAGKPEVKVSEAVLDFGISADERDAAGKEVYYSPAPIYLFLYSDGIRLKVLFLLLL